MLTFADIEKDEAKQVQLQQQQEQGIEATPSMPFLKNKKLVITAVVFVAVLVGGYIVYKKVLVKKQPVTAAF
jgi:hypothetical protein